MQVLQFRINMAACPVDRDPAVQKLLQLSNSSSLSVHLIVGRGTMADGYRYRLCSPRLNSSSFSECSKLQGH